MVERGGGDVCVFSDLCRGGHYCLVSFSDRRGVGTLAICRVLFLYIFRKNGEVNYKNYVFLASFLCFRQKQSSNFGVNPKVPSSALIPGLSMLFVFFSLFWF